VVGLVPLGRVEVLRLRQLLLLVVLMVLVVGSLVRR
jgi:hypothetical protein